MTTTTTTTTTSNLSFLFLFMVLLLTTILQLPSIVHVHEVEAFIVSPQSSSSSSRGIGLMTTTHRPTTVTGTAIRSAIAPTRVFAATSNSIENNESENDQQQQYMNNSASSSASVVLVLGGSGYIGRRVCQELVVASSSKAASSNNNSKEIVISVSRSGKPPLYYLDDHDDNNKDWSNEVEWIQHDLLLANDDVVDNDSLLANKILQVLETIILKVEGEEEKDKKNTLLANKILQVLETTIPVVEGEEDKNKKNSGIDLTVVGCIGDLNPNPVWEGLWGLGFDNERLFRDNGHIYAQFLKTTLLPLVQQQVQVHLNLQLQRFVLLSIDYLDGYVDGKRYAETKFVETLPPRHPVPPNCNSNADPQSHRQYALDNVIVIGLSSFVYGGKRFQTFGKVYRSFVESFIAKGYVKSNEALRSLSTAGAEDWVEKMLFSSPIDVTTVGKITAMAVDASSNGVITRDTVNNGQPRKQGFFNETGKPILYDDLLFIDGTQEIEKLVASSSSNENDNKNKTKNKNKKQSSSVGMPSNEGAGIGKRPYLFPIPVTIAFLLFFWSVATEQFVTPIVTDIAATTVLL
eukprot:CAMPEP_0171032014 /NCGR_PEP_ID=MMETSP0736-20130129/38039_1 /TAXON_ID=186038 /ORGANISM="Fragilariopsis kerguelensis, Strain L26-C5" /LENGTH=575 /DNA_ID=CAMNT_0011474487 /DNA_START=200 /DNA_END=1928 /DNA_ORIENTATION=-